MDKYLCPTCGEKMERDLLLFVKHTDNHVVEALKKQHPQWITKDGFCNQCLDHFKQALKAESDSPEPETKIERIVNIGKNEITKRRLIGILFFLVAFSLLYWLDQAGKDRLWRWLAIVPFFIGTLGFIQAKRKLCVLLGMKGARDMDFGEQRIDNDDIVASLQRESKMILLVSFLAALVLTALSYFFL